LPDSRTLSLAIPPFKRTYELFLSYFIFSLAIDRPPHNLPPVMQNTTTNGQGEPALEYVLPYSNQLNAWLFSSHLRQFNGEDYQAICWDFLNSKEAKKIGLTENDTDIWQVIESSPHPDCTCGFCESAPWE
jgi:hypothetical protein